MTTYNEATNNFYTPLVALLTGPSKELIGYVPDYRIRGILKEGDNKEFDINKYCCRISRQTVLSGQDSLKDKNKRYTTIGFVVVQLFAPIDDIKAEIILGAWVQLFLDEFRKSKPSDPVWYRRARPNELNPEAAWHRTNVLCDFEYNEYL